MATTYRNLTTPYNLTVNGVGVSSIAGSLAVAGNVSGLNLSGTNTGDQTITLTGDVAGSGTGSFAATIAANAVTVAKLQQIATASFLGRTTAATGNVEVLTTAQAKTLLALVKADVGLGNVDNTSDVTKFTSPTFTGTPLTPTATPGTNTTQVASTAFVTAAVAAGGGGGGMTVTTVSSANVAPALTKTIYIMETGGVARTVQLPITCPATFQLVVNASGAQVTILSNGNTIDGVGAGNDLVLQDGNSVTLVCKATGQLEILAGSIPGPAGVGIPAGGAANTVLTKNTATDYDSVWVLSYPNIDGVKGDLTVSGNTTSYTINANAVTVAKMQQIATASFLGRTTAATGNVEVLTTVQAKSMLGLVKADVGLGNVDNTSDVTERAAAATLTNKTMTGANNVVTASLLKSATTEVSISAATAPTVGQVMTATSSTTATWQTPAGGGGGSPGGSTGSVQYNNGTGFSGATGVMIGSSGDLALVEDNSPVVPATGTLGLFSRNMGGRQMLGMIGPSGLDSILQPHIARNTVAQWQCAGNVTTFNFWGGASATLTATGTLTASTLANNSRYLCVGGVEALVTPASTIAVAGFRSPVNRWWRGASGNDFGGFHLITQFGTATGTGTSTRRAFVGMSGIATGTAPTDVNPSTLLNSLGFGYDAADTNWQFMYNGASGTATKIDTGIARPSADRTSIYDVMVFNAAGGTVIGFLIRNLTTLAEFSGTIDGTTKVPLDTVALGYRSYVSVGGTSSIVGIKVCKVYIETDY